VKYNTTIKLIGLFLLLSGWVIVLASLALLRQPPAKAEFLLAGCAVELAGLTLLTLGHRTPDRWRR